MPRHIPIELYALIFQHITSQAELSDLCPVSRAFRDEAQRMLYHTVRLPNDHDRLVSWCHAVVENPRLAMNVSTLFLPASFEHGWVLQAQVDLKLPELQLLVKRALSFLSRLIELHAFRSSGTFYLTVNILCGHPFRLQVLEEDVLWPKPGEWLEFLSEQPGIRHCRLNATMGHPIDPDVLPSLTTAQVYSSALNILTLCPMISALRVMRSPVGHNDLSTLKVFRHTLTSLSLCSTDHLMELNIIRDAVPNIKFLGLQPQYGVSSLVQFVFEFY
jgi:hypothetical protein